MSKNIKDIAELFAPKEASAQKIRQKVRDEIRRQKLHTVKVNGRLQISDEDAEKILFALKERKKMSAKNLEDHVQESSRNEANLEEILKNKDLEIARLNKKLEEYADSFKEMSAKFAKLADQAQQLNLTDKADQVKKLQDNQPETQKELKKKVIETSTIEKKTWWKFWNKLFL